MCARLARAAARRRALTLVPRRRSVPATGAMTRVEPVMSHLRSTLVAPAVAAGLAANTAMAAAQEAKIELTPFAGYYFASGLYGTGGTRVSLENDFTWGIRLTRTRGNGGFELGYTKAGSDAKLVTILPASRELFRHRHDDRDEPQGEPEARGSLARHGYQAGDGERHLVRPVRLLLPVRLGWVRQRRADRGLELRAAVTRSGDDRFSSRQYGTTGSRS
jgi:hypothetical protein